MVMPGYLLLLHLSEAAGDTSLLLTQLSVQVSTSSSSPSRHWGVPSHLRLEGMQTPDCRHWK